MKRISLILLATCLVTFGTFIVNADAEEMRVWIRAVTGEGIEMMNKEIIPAFEKLHPGVKVEFRPLTWANNYMEINTAIAAGNPPDIMSLGRPTALKYAAQGSLLELTDYVMASGLYDDLYPWVWRDSTDLEGRVMAICSWIDLFPFIYNKQVFRDSGLDPEVPPDNWEEFEDYAAKMTKRDAKGRILRSGFKMDWGTAENDWMGLVQNFASFLWSNGGNFLDPETWKESALDRPEAIEALEFYKHLLVDLKVDEFRPWGEPSFLTQWKKGQHGMRMFSTAFIESLRGYPEEFAKLGIALPPKKKTRATFAGGTDLGISSQSKNPDLAFEFIEFLYRTDDYLIRLDQNIGWQLPPVKDLGEAYYAKQIPITKRLFETLPYGQGFEPIPENMEVRKRTAEAVEEALYQVKTPAQAFKDAASDINKLLAKTTWTKTPEKKRIGE